MSIIVIDSGVGGLGILGRLRELMPEKNYVYFADRAAFPYGNASEEYLGKRAEINLLRLSEAFRAECVVIACNTLTAAAVGKLRKTFDFPVVGVEPSVIPAAKAFPEGKIYVFSTTFTSSSGRIARRFASFKDRIEFIPTPRLAELIEKLSPEKEIAECISESAEGKIPEIYAGKAFPIVLGCTHYPLVKPIFRRIFPRAVIFDGTEGTARRVLSVISEREKSEFVEENAGFGEKDSGLSEKNPGFPGNAETLVGHAFRGEEVRCRRFFAGGTRLFFVETVGGVKNSEKMSDLFALYSCKDCLFTV